MDPDLFEQLEEEVRKSDRLFQDLMETEINCQNMLRSASYLIDGRHIVGTVLLDSPWKSVRKKAASYLEQFAQETGINYDENVIKKIRAILN